MLELERYGLSQLRAELRTTAEQAERLARALAGLEMLTPPLPKPSATRPTAVPTRQRKGSADA